jgi:predicted RND superfamily exporter protein
MLKGLGNVIEKRPIVVITLVLLITIGFAILIPGLEMKTDFMDFMPDDEVVESFWNVARTFGRSKIVLFLYIDKLKAESAISVNAVREIQHIEEELLKLDEVNGSLSIITILDQICFVEFGDTLKNCTDEQIRIALYDILGKDFPVSIQTFNIDDPNEQVDYNRFPRISKGKSTNEIDIKNCYVSYNNESFTFSFKVYDLSSFKSKLKSPIPFTNVVEWYLSFENMIRPDPLLDIEYKITVHIEPKHSLWEIGKGPLKNIKSIFQIIRNRELFNSYKKEAYLWIKQKEMPFAFPILLETAEINFDTQKNIIKIDVSRDELGKYGVALRYEFFELPAKLTNFKAGTRYYQTPIGRLPWLRISANTNFILEALEKIMNRPTLGNIANKLLKKFANFSYEDFDELFEYTDEFISLPDQIALKDMEESWVNCDVAPDSGHSENVIFIKTPLYEETKVSILAILSNDFEMTQKPRASMMIIYLDIEWTYEEQVSKTEALLTKIEEIDSHYDYVSVKVTGESVISYQLNEVTIEANTIIAPMIFIMIIAVLYLSFRRVSYVILPLLALVVSMIWIFGTMALLGIPFSTISIAIIPLIMGLGVDYSVHLSHHYRLELSKGKTPAEAIKKSVFEIGTAMFLAMITTVIAFLSFLSASIPPLRDLGLILALGIFFTFITAITLQASIRYTVDRKKKNLSHFVKKSYKLNIMMGKLAKVVLGHQKKIFASLIIVTIFAGVGATQIETGFDLYSFLPEDNPAMEILSKVEEDFPYVGQVQEFILLEGDIANVKALNGVMKTHNNLEDDTFIARKSDGTANAESIYTIIYQAAKNNESMVEKFNLDEETKLPKTNADAKRLLDYLWESFMYGIQTQLSINKTEDGRYDIAVIRVYINIATAGRKTGELEKDLKIMYDEFQEDLEDYGDVKAIPTGQWIITHKITTELTESQILSTAISITLASIVLVIAYRRLTLGLIAIIPVLISIVWILGTMYFIGYNLDVLTITVSSLTIGIGIDYAIHATERFRLVADKTGDIKAALYETIEKTGGALVIAALTTILGFGVLIFAPLPPQAKFGVIMVLTITFSLLTSVLLLPLILARWAKWSKKKKGYIISSKPIDKDYLDEINNSNKK